MRQWAERSLITAVTGVLAIYCAAVPAQESPEPFGHLDLSAEVMALLGAEMREITGASQGLVFAIASGDWASLERISEQIRASYVMEKSLSPSQRDELESALPDHFKALDAEFHARAGKLGDAAVARDPEMAAYQFSRLLETCASCHARYARERFPGFSLPQQDHHGP